MPGIYIQASRYEMAHEEKREGGHKEKDRKKVDANHGLHKQGSDAGMLYASKPPKGVFHSQCDSMIERRVPSARKPLTAITRSNITGSITPLGPFSRPSVNRLKKQKCEARQKPQPRSHHSVKTKFRPE